MSANDSVANDVIVPISAAAYVALEKALGARIQYVAHEYPDHVRHGFQIVSDFRPRIVVFPDGAGTSVVDCAVALLTGEKW